MAMSQRFYTGAIGIGLLGVVSIFGFLLFASEEYHQEKLTLEKDQISLIKSFMHDTSLKLKKIDGDLQETKEKIASVAPGVHEPPKCELPSDYKQNNNNNNNQNKPNGNNEIDDETYNKMKLKENGGRKKKWVMCNYADNCCARSQPNGVNSALQHGFDKAFGYQRKDMDPVFQKKNEKILNQGRGAGYWLWKPYVILKALMEECEPGDVVMYVDSGVHFVGSIDLLKERYNHKEVVVFAQETPEYKWTKRDAFILMGLDHKNYTDSYSADAAYVIIHNTPLGRGFVRDWLRWCEDERILTDLENTQGQPDLPGFQAHRHDQSVLSLTRKLWGIPHDDVPDGVADGKVTVHDRDKS